MQDKDNMLPAGATSSTYNGWSNRETWLANLWLDEMLINETTEGREVTADLVETLIDEMISATDVDSGLTYDLLMTAVGRIHYHEIAEAYK
jgi:hypothetical protein